MSKSSVTLLLVLVLYMVGLKSQTNVSGSIVKNTTWTLANSPYIVTDTIKVKANIILTIEAGVTIKVADSKRIEINGGSLIANGTLLKPIIFTSNSNNPTLGKWEGILFNTVQSSSTQLEYCHFSYAKKAIGTVFRVGNPNYITINQCSFTMNNIGILCSSGYLYRIGFSKFKLNDIGIRYENAGTAPGISVNNCLLDSNKQFGIDLNVGRNTINYCHIRNNGVGINDVNARGRVFIGNLLEHNGTGLKMGLKTDPTDTIYCNTFCSNINYHLYNGGAAKDTFKIPNNYWCSSDTAAISKLIFDKRDNPNLGLAMYLPFQSVSCSVSLYLQAIRSQSNNVKVSPNPVEHLLYFEVPNSNHMVNVLILNALGQTILTSSNIMAQEPIDVSQLPSGIYYLQTISDGNLSQTKFVKM